MKDPRCRKDLQNPRKGGEKPPEFLVLTELAQVVQTENTNEKKPVASDLRFKCECGAFIFKDEETALGSIE